MSECTLSRREPDNGSAIARFSVAIDAYPAAFTGNPLNLLFLEDAQPIRSAVHFKQQLDSPMLTEERREYLLGAHHGWPFPTRQVGARPDPLRLSERLFERFDAAVALLPCLRDIAASLAERARLDVPDIVLLVIADGLSYYDLPDNSEASPCLVEGVTITEFGYRAAVGSPPISRRLFAVGYRNQVGYTFYSPQASDLAADVFFPFSESQVVKVNAFAEMLADLGSRRLVRSYVQVALPGLDQLAHSHRDRPPREHYLGDLLAKYETLVSCLASGGRRVLACLTADHGILWREAFQEGFIVAQDLYSEDARSPRYLKGHVARNYARCVTCNGQRYTLLRFPYITRSMRANEWGVHGGISAWESLVPYLLASV